MSLSRYVRWSSLAFSVLLLAGCATMNPWAEEDQQARRNQQPKPLVMPGEMEQSPDTQQQRSTSPNRQARIEPSSQTQSTPGQSKSSRRSSRSGSSSASPLDLGSGSSSSSSQSSSSTRSRSSQESLIEPSIVDPQQAETLAKEAHQAYEQGNLTTAVDKFKRASQLDPSTPSYPINIGSIYFNREDYEQAARFYKKALQIDSNNEEAHLYLGASYMRMGRTSKARRHLEKTLSLNSNNDTARRLLNQLSD